MGKRRRGSHFEEESVDECALERTICTGMSRWRMVSQAWVRALLMTAGASHVLTDYKYQSSSTAHILYRRSNQLVMALLRPGRFSF